uniref:probable low affinity copper uptake protein 2 n=1 Tax=Styela clava TaxID=7725 RepID=UPI00193A51DF|nr:probable low affinity copper uptake protein 2 [Styela clava]
MEMDMNSDTMPTMTHYFNTKLPVAVAFEGWIINNSGTLAGSCIGVAGLAIFFEIFKTLRNVFQKNYLRRSPYIYQPNPASNKEISSTNGNFESQYSHFWGMHFLHSIIYIIQIFVGYLLMLVVMVFNVWLTVSVIIGLTLGYFLTFFIALMPKIKALQTYDNAARVGKFNYLEFVFNKCHFACDH